MAAVAWLVLLIRGWALAASPRRAPALADRRRRSLLANVTPAAPLKRPVVSELLLLADARASFPGGSSGIRNRPAVQIYEYSGGRWEAVCLLSAEVCWLVGGRVSQGVPFGRHQVTTMRRYIFPPYRRG